ncbi:hypothetical protein DMB65_21045 [Flavobacterium cheongpyeongense]|uniref:histidine kinase n=1 Tax=Flavobacterium cheongpyeongense TaxID=2212651 RepID=A0A2V4BJR5_9FLAO|nr:sensor histidine kinase [Flavobacterium cheongpyeongense]PXY38812.1 hypothetical protein DMB65_21045 [Flavobacterium cheongpyeongense]
MYEFMWNCTISYLILFLVLSIFMSIYNVEKSFKFYGMYLFTIIIYLFTKNEYLYHLYLENLKLLFNPVDALRFSGFFNWYLQVLFYNFYFIFSIYFLDLEKHTPVVSNRVIKILLFLFIFFTILFFITFQLNKFQIFFTFFYYLYLPSVLILCLYAVPKALKYSGKHKYWYLIGLSIYIFFALFSFYITVLKLAPNSILYFSIGIILENFCFALGLAYKTILTNDELKKVNSQLEIDKQNQEIATLEALIDGEDKERKRIAQELHDGLNSDLSAIKYHLSTLEESGLSVIDTENLNKVINMIDESCAQVRSISHNLMPSSILEYGLIESIGEYCIKIKSSDNFKIDFQTYGDYIALSKKNETVVYRIIQELVTNILKHSKATEAMIQFNYREDELFITVEDNGIGFDKSAVSNGIGLKNINTRIAFLNAQLDIDSSASGSSYTISINLNKIK